MGLETTCLYIDSVYYKEVDVTGLTRVESNRPFTVFPNPASGIISISGTDEEEIHIFDIVGDKVFSIMEFSNGMSIDVSSFPDGIYILKAGNAVSKFIKK